MGGIEGPSIVPVRFRCHEVRVLFRTRACCELTSAVPRPVSANISNGGVTNFVRLNCPSQFRLFDEADLCFELAGVSHY